ncbi:MAG: rare lipoprotein [Actinomycetota bacterium]|jgi:rare lipoprotein A (peptidoglycan hydrolase)|nr:rare lipoprotein [Actinomycetota bacterium]
MSGTALAQTPGRQPVIDSAPSRVHYRGGGTIAGHLEGWVAGDEVSLQRQSGDTWTTTATKAVDESGAISFDLAGMRRTRVFRFVYIDPTSAVETASETRKIEVGAQLTFHLSEDHVMQGHTVTASGRLTQGAGRWVAIQQRSNGRWRSLGTAYEHDGRYALRFDANKIGGRRIRAVFKGDSRNTRAHDGTKLRVYDPALATWYGPGFWGHGTACGQTLRGDTLGVAHRTLPCGTEVALLFRGRTIVVKVIDRGPYSRADWDLTQETAERLGFTGTDTIGVDPVRR